MSWDTSNAGLLEDMYARYQKDPSTVGPSWQRTFAEMDRNGDGTVALQRAPAIGPAPIRIYNLLAAYRTYGHLLADINPIDPEPIQSTPELDPQLLGFSPEEMSQPFPTCGLMQEEEAPLEQIISILSETYCDRIGVEYMGLQRPEMEAWLQKRIEPSRFRPTLSIEQKKLILQHLNRSELFEIFLNTKYTGQKRFSIEGGETLIPMLAAVIEEGAKLGSEQFVIGMAHRGRLNVLSNILQKDYTDIFSEFEEAYIPDSFEGSGDVKYHKGFESDYKTDSGHKVHVELPANPSHLESVDTVVEGICRAKQVASGDDLTKNRSIPILIHGDAAIAGQGIIYEALQLYNLPGYSTGGTIHLVINNQIGFTTLPQDGRSTHYCTDIARAFSSPVFHVNVEDPEGCVHATNMAVALRHRFGCDVFIDLNCYRKYGHNEGDEPAYTQPLEYQLIRKKKAVREVYRDFLIEQGHLEKAMAEQLEASFKAGLQEALDAAKAPSPRPKPRAETTRKGKEFFRKTKTAVPAKTLKALSDILCTVPEGFNINRKLLKIIEQRQKMLQGKPKEKTIDWGMGEHLAFATLLNEGVHVRLSGQDSRRGTFSHRHAMWLDQKNAKKYFPLSNLSPNQGRFDVFNSPLSEYGVLGFEFGYSLVYKDALVIWEAQFGDFSNGAQVIIDQFISTAEQKWGRAAPLVLLLPHGYEGQGPEHSSARMERFLQLSGDMNMQVCDCTTPAQLFHLLRRQVKREAKKPLIVFTPKGLLRFPACVSSVQDFSKGTFEEIIDDEKAPKKVKRIAFCTGRVYYDLIAERENSKKKDLAIVRVEQLYPMHEERLIEVLGKYKDVKEVLWVQEEPKNMGAWDFIRPWILDILPPKVTLKYVGRARSASPAAGSHELHKQQHVAIMKEIFG